MNLNMACSAQPGHKKVLSGNMAAKSIVVKPTVISSKRFDGIMSRARQDERKEMLAAVEEEQRYKQYLKDGSEALCQQFTNVSCHQVTDEATLQKNRDKLLAEKTKDLRAKQLLEEQRKERIMRANRLLHLMKPGPRSLQQALLQSETIKQRRFYDAVNKDIAQDELHQKQLEAVQCPEVIIPFGHMTEEQQKAEQKEKTLSIRADILKDLEERRQRRLDERKQEIYESAVNREQFKKQMAKDDQAAKELLARKREACRRAYKDALKEKSERNKFEGICEQIDHRIRCVNRVAKRQLDTRYGNQIMDMRSDQIRDREARAMRVCQRQQENTQNQEEMQANLEEKYQVDVSVNELGRKCRLEELSKQRQAYQQEEREQEDQKRLRNAEIRRFEIASRYRNEQVNRRFYDAEKERHKKLTDDLRDVLCGQRQQLLQRRQDNLMRLASCSDDPHLQDDADFFDEAAHLMQESQELGRPLYPLTKAVDGYKRDNQIDPMPKCQLVRRSTLRDVCWPNYLSKAELAYKKYEQRDKCCKETEKKRRKIMDDCLRISQMASEERPFKPSVQSGLIRCLQYKDMPVMDNNETNDTKPTNFQPEDIMDNVDPLENSNEQDDTQDLPIAEKQESNLSAGSKRASGGYDITTAHKRDGISRSLIGIVSTKQKRSTKLNDGKINSTPRPTPLRAESILLETSSRPTAGACSRSSSAENQKRLNRLKILTPKGRTVGRETARSSKVYRKNGLFSKPCIQLPDLNRYLISKPETQRNDTKQSTISRNNSDLLLSKQGVGFQKQKPFAKLPDLTCYKQKTQKPFGVAELLAPDEHFNRFPSSPIRCTKLPDLAQYWTPAIQQTKANQRLSSILPSNEFNHRFFNSENRKKTG